MNLPFFLLSKYFSDISIPVYHFLLVVPYRFVTSRSFFPLRWKWDLDTPVPLPPDSPRPLSPTAHGKVSGHVLPWAPQFHHWSRGEWDQRTTEEGDLCVRSFGLLFLWYVRSERPVFRPDYYPLRSSGRLPTNTLPMPLDLVHLSSPLSRQNLTLFRSLSSYPI